MKLRPVITATLLIRLLAIVAQAAEQDEHRARRLIEFRVPGAATVVSAQCGPFCGTQAPRQRGARQVSVAAASAAAEPGACAKNSDGSMSSSSSRHGACETSRMRSTRA
jgi:hypothetical protein